MLEFCKERQMDLEGKKYPTVVVSILYFFDLLRRKIF